MAVFHSKWVRNRGGLRRRAMRRVVGETVEEMARITRAYPEATVINWPPRSHDSWRSRSIPALWLDADREDILTELGSCEVSEEHIIVLTMMIREELYRTRVGHTPETEKFFELEVRGKMIQLLKSGSWVDHPESLSLQNLNSRLEKIDLGRRSDLNFSSRQSLIGLKYDQDLRAAKKEQRKQGISQEPEMDWEELYRDGSKDVRKEIVRSRPWMRIPLTEKYGQP